MSKDEARRRDDDKAALSEREFSWLNIRYALILGAGTVLLKIGATVALDGWKGLGSFLSKSISLETLAPGLLVGMWYYLYALGQRAAKIHDHVSNIETITNTELKECHKEVNKLHVEANTYKNMYHMRALSEVDHGYTINVRISNFNNFLAYLPLYIADGLKFLRQERISIKIVQKGNDLDAVKALTSGEAQFSITDPIFASEEHDPGNNIRILSPFLNKAAVWAISKEKISGLDCLAKFKILTYSTNSTAYHLCTRFKEKYFKKCRDRTS